MSQLIIIIIIIAWIYQKRKKAQEANPDSSKTGNKNITTAGQPVRELFMDKRNDNRSQIQQRASSKTKVEAMKADGHSTTAYLQEKADADAREHAREKFEEQKRQRENSRGLAVGERLYLGDPVPQGKKCVICGYCAAENLIPMVPRTKYSCYFCREPLN